MDFSAATFFKPSLGLNDCLLENCKLTVLALLCLRWEAEVFFCLKSCPPLNGRTSYGSNPFPLYTPLPGLSTPYPSTPIALGTFVFLWPSDPDPACILPSGHVIRIYLSASLWDNQDLLRVGTKCILVSSLLKDTKNKLLFSREDTEECGS